MKDNRKFVLILGIHQSGTSLLESLVVNHPDVAGLFESLTEDTFKLMGKEFCINKLTTRQIRPKLRANILFFTINRVVNFCAKFTGKLDYKVLPVSRLSVKDYVDRGAKLIIIGRHPTDIINSLIERRHYSREFATKHWKRMNKILNEIISNFEHLYVHFDDLVLDTEYQLRRICEYIGLEYKPIMLEGYRKNFMYPNDKIVKEKAYSYE
jgi:hypothetical protein